MAPLSVNKIAFQPEIGKFFSISAGKTETVIGKQGGENMKAMSFVKGMGLGVALGTALGIAAAAPVKKRGSRTMAGQVMRDLGSKMEDAADSMKL